MSHMCDIRMYIFVIYEPIFQSLITLDIYREISLFIYSYDV